ncbi:MAG: hypothetical protein QM690_21790 [Sphingobium sp.]
MSADPWVVALACLAGALYLGSVMRRGLRHPGQGQAKAPIRREQGPVFFRIGMAVAGSGFVFLTVLAVVIAAKGMT